MFLLPALESATVAIAIKHPLVWVVLGGVALLHLILGVLLLKAQPPDHELVLLEAGIELETAHQCRKEMERRREAYRLIQHAFAQLNSSGCSVSSDLQEHEWDPDRAFRAGLQRILQPLAVNSCTTVGICKPKFTVEVYIGHSLSGQGWSEALEDPVRAYVHCNGVAIPGGLDELSERHVPAFIAWTTGAARHRSVKEDRDLFYNGEELRSGVYYRRYAAVRFGFACTDQPLGVLVLTAMQDEPLAEDILDTLAFLGTLVAHYFQSYLDYLYGGGLGRGAFADGLTQMHENVSVMAQLAESEGNVPESTRAEIDRHVTAFNNAVSDARTAHDAMYDLKAQLIPGSSTGKVTPSSTGEPEALEDSEHSDVAATPTVVAQGVT
jgi:hypothetical protein